MQTLPAVSVTESSSPPQERTRILDFAENRLRAMLDRPDAWGPPEAVELQVLLLLEVCMVVKGSDTRELESLQRRYDRFLAWEVGGPPTSLAARLGLDQTANETFTRLLKRFCEEELKR